MDETENPYSPPADKQTARRETRIYAALAIVVWLLGSLFVGGMHVLLWPVYTDFELDLPFIVRRSFLMLPAAGMSTGVLLQVLISVFSSTEWKPFLQAASILLAIVFFMVGLYTLVYPLAALIRGLI